MKLIIKRASVARWVCFLAFLFICGAYNFYFALDHYSYIDDYGLFQRALNIHDHYIYQASVERVADGGRWEGLENNTGIALIYYFISKTFMLPLGTDLAVTAFIVNSLTLLICFRLYVAVCRQLGLGQQAQFGFFLCLFFIYFSALINKDMLTIAAFLFVIWAALAGKEWWIIASIPLLLLVRVQLGIFALVFMFIAAGRRTWPRFLISYIACSVFGSYVVAKFEILEMPTLGEGFSAFVWQFNQDYYVGYLIFNPIRALQFVVDVFSSFYFFTDNGGIDVAKLLRLPALLLVVLMGRYIKVLFLNWRYFLRTPARVLMIAIMAYLMVWLMNPTINARYVSLIMPVILIILFYVRKESRGFQRNQAYRFDLDFSKSSSVSGS